LPRDNATKMAYAQILLIRDGVKPKQYTLQGEVKGIKSLFLNLRGGGGEYRVSTDITGFLPSDEPTVGTTSPTFLILICHRPSFLSVGLSGDTRISAQS
jgi:hypothetical protein